MKTVKQLSSRRIFANTELRRTLRLIGRNRVSMLGLLIVGSFLIVGMLAPWLVSRPDDAWGTVMHIENQFRPPSLAYPFGTDEFGRDILSRVTLGTRFSLLIGVSVVVLAFAIGVPLGIVSGYVGGRVASVLMRVTDMFLAFPPILIAIALVMVIGRGLINTIISLAISWWPWYARLGYVQANQTRGLPFMEAAKVIGVRKLPIVFRHLLPNTLTPVMVQAALDVGSAVLEAAAMSFLGLGVQSPTPEWGLLTSEGWVYINRAWWITIFPGLAIFIFVLGFNLLGDALRESMDPRLRNVSTG